MIPVCVKQCRSSLNDSKDNDISPLLSVGYVSGFLSVDAGDVKSVKHVKHVKTLKHIIVNGAFNHGNSGGPLLIARNNEVIGIVVLTFNFYPAEVKQIIEGLSNQRSGFQVGTITRPDGTKENLSEAQVTAMVLNEFYQKTQVMIGEAVAGSELAKMLKEHAGDLPAAATPSPSKVMTPSRSQSPWCATSFPKRPSTAPARRVSSNRCFGARCRSKPRKSSLLFDISR